MLGNHRNRRSSTESVASVLKILIGIGILTVTIAMISLFNEMISPHSPSGFLQLMVAGAVIVGMSWLSYRIYEEWV